MLTFSQITFDDENKSCTSRKEDSKYRKPRELISSVFKQRSRAVLKSRAERTPKVFLYAVAALSVDDWLQRREADTLAWRLLLTVVRPGTRQIKSPGIAVAFNLI